MAGTSWMAIQYGVVEIEVAAFMNNQMACHDMYAHKNREFRLVAGVHTRNDDSLISIVCSRCRLVI